MRDGEHEATSLRDDVLLSYRGRVIRPKTLGQKRYVDAIRSNTITFGLGPAGTGKTYLAMALAVAALKRHEVGRLILTRPVVEAGENLGFLPGTLEEKIDPYMRPLYDALFCMMDRERTDELMERGVIEIAPLAYMRGRTLSDAFVVLDEAQNTTPEQMKMFLTRLGFNSKFVITGDLSQRDLVGRRGGLADVEKILGRVDDVAFLTSSVPTWCAMPWWDVSSRHMMLMMTCASSARATERSPVECIDQQRCRARYAARRAGGRTHLRGRACRRRR